MQDKTADPGPDDDFSAGRRRLLTGTAAGVSVFVQSVDAQTAKPAARPVEIQTGEGRTESPGKSVTIFFDGKRCIHARYCVLGAPTVFLANVKGPWINPDAEAVEHVIHTVRQCPSGALTYKRNDGGAEEPAPKVNLVRLRENGPLAVHAKADVKGGDEVLRATLCRCGASKTKPYCDNSHKAAKFSASGEAAPGANMKPLAERAGTLTVTPLTDGPYLVQGNMEIVTGTGATIARTTNAILCRCGGSKNKPYCDGTHSVVRFKAKGHET
ncbi:MAG: CDGSH iron-sulfur domain-containing protein [Burkholderiales bacterium]|nr:CDGSH iron-sulfur domain-containing protein [Burkholderiales bacterium]